MPFKSTTRSQTARIAIALILATMVISGMTGCLVKKKDLEKIARTTDKLRIYQPGDYITYNVTATRVPNAGGIPETQTGTLVVEWKLHSNLIVPFTGGNDQIPVIQEVTTLNLNGGASNQGTVRYISQDTNGQVTLHAIEGTDSTADEHYWLNHWINAGLDNLQIVEPITIFNSPITFGDQDFDGNPNIDMRILEGCEGNATCTAEVGRFIDDHDVVGDSDQITTNLGVFVNPYRIRFEGSATPDTTFPVTFDIRDVCGTDFTTHRGTMYVMPEVGIIQMSNTCADTANTVIYSITLTSTNISLP